MASQQRHCDSWPAASLGYIYLSVVIYILLSTNIIDSKLVTIDCDSCRGTVLTTLIAEGLFLASWTAESYIGNSIQTIDGWSLVVVPDRVQELCDKHTNDKKLSGRVCCRFLL